MTKKIEPSEFYLKTLEEDLAVVVAAFEQAKRSLYRQTATAKLGQPEFETARLACLETNKQREKVESEIAKVKKALGKK